MFSFKMPPFPVVLAPMAGVTDLLSRHLPGKWGGLYGI